jgi:hypothetical protein
MNVIIIENAAYSVTKPELRKIRKIQRQLNFIQEKDYPNFRKEELAFSDYLTQKVESGEYKSLGAIQFDFRL